MTQIQYSTTPLHIPEGVDSAKTNNIYPMPIALALYLLAGLSRSPKKQSCAQHPWTTLPSSAVSNTLESMFHITFISTPLYKLLHSLKPL